jgi:ferric-dicitrate binding protein FerR (iron transport regulator)
MYLDSAGNGELARQGQTSVVKLKDGRIVYKGAGAGSGLQYNTLFVPEGSQIAQLSLEDGTRVWINAGSSLKYPAAFTGKERAVEVMGEAYFEVSRNTDQPFIVHINTVSPGGGSTVQVLGTHFNINAYRDEEDVKVTLLEGSVRVNHQAAASVLHPGEQARVSQRIKVVNDVDAGETVAWKNGRFSYNNAGLEEIMRQISRWYGVEVVYDEKITDEYTINVPRTIPVSQLLKFIELSGGVHFMLEGKKVIVKK